MFVVLIRIMEMSGELGIVYVWVEGIGQAADFDSASPLMVHKSKSSPVGRHLEQV